MQKLVLRLFVIWHRSLVKPKIGSRDGVNIYAKNYVPNLFIVWLWSSVKPKIETRDQVNIYGKN